MSIAVKIVQAREAAGLSQKELAARMGTTLQVISRLESGNYSYTLKTLEKIATAIGTRLEINFVPLMADIFPVKFSGQASMGESDLSR